MCHTGNGISKSAPWEALWNPRKYRDWGTSKNRLWSPSFLLFMALVKTLSLLSASAPISVKCHCNTKLPERWCWLHVRCLYVLFHSWKRAAFPVTSLHLHCQHLRPGYHYLLQLQPSRCSSCLIAGARVCMRVCVYGFYSNIILFLSNFILAYLHSYYSCLLLLLYSATDVFNFSNKPRFFSLQGLCTSLFCWLEGSWFHFLYDYPFSFLFSFSLNDIPLKSNFLYNAT